MDYVELTEDGGSKEPNMRREGGTSRLVSRLQSNAELSRSSLYTQAGRKQSELRAKTHHEHCTKRDACKLHPTISETSRENSEISIEGSVLGPEPASKNTAIFNLANTCLGTGVLTMPYACKLCGIFVFLLLLCTITVGVIWSLRFLVNALEAPKDTTEATYKNATVTLCGLTIAVIVDWSLIFTLLGTCIAYVNIIGALLPPIFALAATSPDSILCGTSGILLWQIVISVSRFRV